MSNLTLTIFEQAGDDSCVSVTEHSTLTEALNEFDGWNKTGKMMYMVQGTMTLDCACKRLMESRNRVIRMSLRMDIEPYSTVSNSVSVDLPVVELKAPQACKLLQLAKAGAAQLQEGNNPDEARVRVTITNSVFQVG